MLQTTLKFAKTTHQNQTLTSLGSSYPIFNVCATCQGFLVLFTMNAGNSIPVASTHLSHTKQKTGKRCIREHHRMPEVLLKLTCCVKMLYQNVDVSNPARFTPKTLWDSKWCGMCAKSLGAMASWPRAGFGCDKGRERVTMFYFPLSPNPSTTRSISANLSIKWTNNTCFWR